MNALLLAAGLGTRLRPLTDKIPKCLVPINGKPLLEIWLETLSEAGIENFVINTHYLHEQVETFVTKSKFYDRITLTYEQELLGTGGTLLCNKRFFDDGKPFLVAHADNLSLCDYKDFISHHSLRPKPCIATMMTFKPDDLHGCGVVVCNQEGVVEEFYEKSLHPPSKIANGAVYMFEKEIFSLLEEYGRDCIDISTEILPKLLGKIYTFSNEDLHIDIGTSEAYQRGETLYKNHNKRNHFLNYFFNYFSKSHIFRSYGSKRQEIQSRMELQKKEEYKSKRVLVIYDFIDLPHSNDIITVLIAAEIERRKYNLEKIDVVFVAHASDPSPLRLSYVTPENYRQFIYNLAIEQVRLLEYGGSLFVFDNRNAFVDFYNNHSKHYRIYPSDYNIDIPVELIPERVSAHQWSNIAPFLQQDSSLLCVTPPFDQVKLARKWIIKYCFPKIPITITLREWDDWADERNSQLDEWQKFIQYYETKEEFIFIIVRDYYKLYDLTDPLTGKNIVYCNEAAISNSFRAALYQESTLNLFVSNGSSAYAVANSRTNYIFFSIYSNGRGAAKEVLRDVVGLYCNDSFQGASEFQKVVWERDRFEVLKRETEKMLKTIEIKLGLLPSFYESGNEEKELILSSVVANRDVIFKPSLMDTRKKIIYYDFFYRLFYFKNEYVKAFNLFKRRIEDSLLIRYKIFALKLNWKSLRSECLSSEFPRLNECIRNIRTEKKKVAIYGAGSIGEALYPLLKESIVFYIDMSGKAAAGDVSKIKCQILAPSAVSDRNREFDYIIVSPKGREIDIAHMLMAQYQIEKEKILFF